MNNRSSAYIAVLIAAVLWGTPYTVVKIGLSILTPSLPPLGYLMLRFFMALLLLLPLLAYTTTRNNTMKLLKNRSIVLLGSINALAYILQFIGQVGTTAAVATLMANTYLISTPILSSYFLGTKISNKQKFAVIGGIGGALLICWSVSSNIALEDTLIFILSTFLVLISGLVWGGYGVASSIISKKAEEEGITEMTNSSAVFVSSNCYSLLMVSVVMIAFNQAPSIESLTIEAWLTVIYLAVFCTILPFILYIRASQVIEATELNIFLLLNIIVSLVIANILLSECLSFFGLVGSFLIVFSIYTASSSSN